ncbi:hypothetical protein FSOLCH5_007536 [Fusarium solani]
MHQAFPLTQVPCDDTTRTRLHPKLSLFLSTPVLPSVQTFRLFSPRACALGLALSLSRQQGQSALAGRVCVSHNDSCCMTKTPVLTFGTRTPSKSITSDSCWRCTEEEDEAHSR